MARLHLSSRVRRRWWYGLARSIIAVAVVTRIIRDIEGAAALDVEQATVIEIHTRYAEPTASAEG